MDIWANAPQIISEDGMKAGVGSAVLVLVFTMLVGTCWCWCLCWCWCCRCWCWYYCWLLVVDGRFADLPGFPLWKRRSYPDRGVALRAPRARGVVAWNSCAVTEQQTSHAEIVPFCADCRHLRHSRQHGSRRAVSPRPGWSPAGAMLHSCVSCASDMRRSIEGGERALTRSSATSFASSLF